MKLAGLPVHQLAESIHFEVSSVYKWLNGKRLPQDSSFTLLSSFIANYIADKLAHGTPLEASINRFLLAYAPAPEALHEAASVVDKERLYAEWVKQVLAVTYEQAKWNVLDVEADWSIGQQEPASKKSINKAPKEERILEQDESSEITEMNALAGQAEMYWASDSYYRLFSRLLEEAAHIQPDGEKKIVSIVHWGNDIIHQSEGVRTPIIELLQQLAERQWVFDIGYVHDQFEGVTFESFMKLLNSYIDCTGIRYYFSKHSCKMISFDRIAVVAGVGAVMSYATEGRGDLTLLVRDEQVVAQLLAYYEKVMQGFQPVLEQHSQDPLIQIYAEEWNFSYSDVYAITPSLPPVLMSDQLFESVLKQFSTQTANEPHMQKFVDNMREKKGSTVEALHSYHFYCIFAKCVFLKFLRAGKMKFFGQQMSFTVAERIDCIRHLIQMVQMPTVNILIQSLQDSDFRDVKRFILYDEEHLILQMPTNSRSSAATTSTHVSIHNAYITNLYKARYLNHWEHSDWKTKDKLYWITWLEKQLVWLEKML
ncbi:hypothetical protein [Paenibacillus sp. 481]|uniref:hypothetical protein n=1 Tax=Paenibacillus sp. 481 TaxID=2835869 RepID=UPI001E420660|nr:hypothetical protein [Paenibacillus sp. 481]UHA72143.1 hypothetical protein KIK04_15715 [Paenibacillus sp. 481]